MVFSPTVPVELAPDWPPRTELCECCGAGLRPVSEEPRGLKIISMYACPGCEKRWVATWRVDE